jgi:hypothetical protein
MAADDTDEAGMALSGSRTEGPGTAAFSTRKAAWDDYFQNPQMAGAILSMAGALAQPAQFGQTGFGHAMSALGAGGDSVRLNEKLDLAQQEAESKGELRAAQGDAAQARAATAETRANAATDRLGMETFKQGEISKRNVLGRRIQFLTQLDRTRLAVEKANAQADLLRQPKQPVPQMTDPQYRKTAIELGLIDEDGNPLSGAHEATPGATPPSSTAVTPQTYPPAPGDAKARTVGTTYQTPKGPLTWTGTGWQQPQN